MAWTKVYLLQNIETHCLLWNACPSYHVVSSHIIKWSFHKCASSTFNDNAHVFLLHHVHDMTGTIVHDECVFANQSCMLSIAGMHSGMHFGHFWPALLLTFRVIHANWHTTFCVYHFFWGSFYGILIRTKFKFCKKIVSCRCQDKLIQAEIQKQKTKNKQKTQQEKRKNTL